MTEVMAAEIEKLIERLEKLTGPDQAADCDIFRAIGAPLPQEFLGRSIQLEFNEAEHCFLMPIGEQRIRYTPPAYTKSIDAALTLVPEWQFVNALNQHQNVWRAEVGNAIRSYKGRSAIPANSPAIALCIASLKAIAALRALATTPPAEGGSGHKLEDS